VANKKQRWYEYLKAAANGRLLERPSIPALWHPHKYYMPQIEGRLQSGYDDVEFELLVMIEHARKNNVAVLFVAGDGLALMRINHLLKNKPHLYIDQTPVVIPIQGNARADTHSLRAPKLCAPELLQSGCTLETPPTQVSTHTVSST